MEVYLNGADGQSRVVTLRRAILTFSQTRLIVSIGRLRRLKDALFWLGASEGSLVIAMLGCVELKDILRINVVCKICSTIHAASMCSRRGETLISLPCA